LAGRAGKAFKDVDGRARGLKRKIARNNDALHTLRHSYATHLHESGTDIYYIRQLLGHKHVKTTEIYTHISKKKLEKIRSPFEDLL